MRNHPSVRWLMISMVFLATLINYLDRQTLSVVAPLLIDQFHMSSVTYSWVIFAFMLAYTFMNGVSGPLIDWLGTRLGYTLTTAWWSAAAMAHALATGPWSLGACRFLLGVGEAGNWPAGVKVVAEWFPAKDRALASGIFNSGSSIGAIIAPPLVVWVVLKLGWRTAFGVVGVVGFLWVLVWSYLYYTPGDATRTPPKSLVFPWRLLQVRFVWSFTLAKVFIDPVWYFYIFWFPEYLKRARHFDLASIGRYAWIPFLAAGVGNVLGGWVCGMALRRGIKVTLARKGTVTIFAILMAATIPAVLVPSVPLSMALVSVAMLGYTGFSATSLAFPADVFPSDTVATIWGLASLGSGVGGMGFALMTGWLVAHYSYVPVFIGFGLIPLLSASIIWLLLGPLEPLKTLPKAHVVPLTRADST